MSLEGGQTHEKNGGAHIKIKQNHERSANLISETTNCGNQVFLVHKGLVGSVLHIQDGGDDMCNLIDNVDKTDSVFNIINSSVMGEGSLESTLNLDPRPGNTGKSKGRADEGDVLTSLVQEVDKMTSVTLSDHPPQVTVPTTFSTIKSDKIIAKNRTFNKPNILQQHQKQNGKDTNLDPIKSIVVCRSTVKDSIMNCDVDADRSSVDDIGLTPGVLGETVMLGPKKELIDMDFNGIDAIIPDQNTPMNHDFEAMPGVEFTESSAIKTNGQLTEHSSDLDKFISGDDFENEITGLDTCPEKSVGNVNLDIFKSLNSLNKTDDSDFPLAVDLDKFPDGNKQQAEEAPESPALATISISTDKTNNTTHILINTGNGQQLFQINTADLAQATNTFQPLALQGGMVGFDKDGQVLNTGVVDGITVQNGNFQA